MAGVWALLAVPSVPSVPSVLRWSESVLWVPFLSLYANFSAEIARAIRRARAEAKD
jgi:hypothetical protein